MHKPKIMIQMHKVNPTRFGFFIIHNTSKIASTEKKFIQLLEHMASIDNGIHLTIPLHSIYEENFDVAVKIYNIIKNSENINLKLASGALLRFIARRNPNILHQEVISNISTDDVIKKRSYVLALLDPFYRSNSSKDIPKSILDFLYDCTYSENLDLKRESITSCMSLLNLDKDRFLHRLKSFVMECEENKLFMCGAIRYTDVTDNGDFEIWLLSLCAELRSKDAMESLISQVQYSQQAHER